jgi:O-acetyl-ADP-ribose deacetylase (regulator of RNase III)
MESAKRINGKQLRIVRGDLTEARVDAIVNAANEQLVLGGGVAGAIARRGGPAIQAACDGLGPIRTGEAVLTTGGDLPARHVIHAAGPRGGQPEADRLLADAVANSLRVAEAHGLASIAFPAISTGIFGYPLESCARILTRTAADWLRDPSHALGEIRVVLFDEPAYLAFRAELEALG